VAFDIHFAENVEQFLVGYDALTIEERVRVIDGVEAELGQDADRFRVKNPLRPPHPDHPDRFWYDFLIAVERDGEVEIFRFWFACDGRGHRFGVTEVLYADRVPV
jgi:hypothetical protein